MLIPPPFTPFGHRPLREVFDTFGREHFPDAWTGDEVDDWKDARTFARWPKALALFAQELEAERIVIVTLTEDGHLDKVPTSYWRVWNADEQLAEYLIEPDRPYYVCMPEGSQKPALTKGRPACLNLDDYKEAFDGECRERGRPHRKNDDREWRTQADVQRWICTMAKREGVEIDPGSTTAKNYARKLMGKN